MADLAARAAKPHINKCSTKLTIFYTCFRNSLKKYTCLFIGTKLVEKVEEEISEMIGKKIPGAKRLDEDAREIRYPSLRRHFRLYRMYLHFTSLLKF